MVCPEEQAREYPGLQDAYAIMFNAVIDDLTLDYWKIVIDTTCDGISQKPSPDEHSGENLDLDIKRAIKASLNYQDKGTKRLLSTQETPPSSPLKRQKITSEVLSASFSSSARRYARPAPCPQSTSSCSSSTSFSSNSQSSDHASNTGNKMSRLSLDSQGMQPVSCENDSTMGPPNSDLRIASPNSSPKFGEADDGEEDEM